MSPSTTLAPPSRTRDGTATKPRRRPAPRPSDWPPWPAPEGGQGDRRPPGPARPPKPRPPKSRPPKGRPTPSRPAGAPPPTARAQTLVRRVRLLRLLLVVVLLLVALRLVQVQVLESGRYKTQAAQELRQPVVVPALRGGIYDRNGAVLAESVPTHLVVADDFQIRHPVTEADALAPLVGQSPAALAALLSRHSGYVPIAHNVSDATATKITAGNFDGVTLLPESERVTPEANLAQPVIGFVNGSGNGAAGLEYADNRELAGRNGSETFLESPAGVVLPGTPVATRTAAKAGVGIETTLDEPLQYTAEQALASAIVSSNAKSGTVVVMDVKTGDILADANLVSNAPSAGSSAPSSTTPPSAQGVTIGSGGPVSQAPSNLAVTETYEPGSVFKLVTFSAALQDGVINPNTTFSVPGQIELDGSIFHDAEPHPTEELTATQILAQSSNIGTSEIAQQLGESRLLAQVQKLGFGQPTDLHFPGESAGLLAGASQWEPTNYVSLPIGQVDAVTAQQVLDAYNSVANGGVLVEPRLVRGTVAADGSVKPAPSAPTRRVMSSGTASTLMSMLDQVVTSGTGTSANVPGYQVAGKTGTAQIPTPGSDSYTANAYMASFVGIVPANHPVLSAIVVLNRPTPIYGGTVAAPVFSQVMTYALQRYHIPTTPGVSTTPPPPSASTADQAQDVT